MCSPDDEIVPPAVPDAIGLTRRGLIAAAAGFAGAAAVGVPDALAQVAQYQVDQMATSRRYNMRWLWMYNPRTKDHFMEIFFDGARYRPEALYRFDVLMRDWRQNKAVQIDRGVYERLALIQGILSPRLPLVITSGYRSPETNKMLAETTPGVARRSMHLWGRAADFQIYNLQPKPVATLINSMKIGGVGAYKRHIHVDSGAPRFWSRV